jgi:hypothetical protein
MFEISNFIPNKHIYRNSLSRLDKPKPMSGGVVSRVRLLLVVIKLKHFVYVFLQRALKILILILL